MIFTATIVIVAVWLSTEVLFAILFASLVLFLTIWRVFVPTYYELNTEGVIRRTIVRKYLIAWEDIRAYEIRTDGIILLPRNDRYFLDFFRAYFLPVPTSLVPEVLYRFRIFVDKIHD